VAPLKANRTEVGARLGELYSLIKTATETRTRADGAWHAAKRSLAEAESGSRQSFARHRDERAAHAANLLAVHREWRRLPLRGGVRSAAINWRCSIRIPIRWNCG